MTRWAIHLSNFNYQIEYISGSRNNLADSLSRLPLDAKVVSDYERVVLKVCNIHCVFLEHTLLSKQQIVRQSAADPILKKVISYVRRGCPDFSTLPVELHTFHTKREELQMEDGMLLWHDRIVIPNNLRKMVLHKLHETHPGASTMRNIAKNTLLLGLRRFFRLVKQVFALMFYCKLSCWLTINNKLSKLSTDFLQ